MQYHEIDSNDPQPANDLALNDPNDRRQQILAAALKVFSSKGFQRATNKDIADAAGGISPGLIYHYFKDKEDLFFSLVRERASIIQLAEHPEQLMALPAADGIALIGRTYLSMMRNPDNIAMIRVLIGDISRLPQIGEMIYRLGVSRIFKLLQNYLQHQIDLGNLRPHDTGIAARSLIGMFITQIIARELFHQPEALAIDDELLIAEITQIFLQGLAK